MTIPRTVDDLTPEWCSDALGREITSVEPDAARGRDGPRRPALPARARRAGTARRPWSRRWPRPTDEGRFVATVLNMYGREASFYERASRRARRSRIRSASTPQHDPETQDAVLLLEDVSPRGRLLDQIAGCSVRDARPAIRALADLHACFWDDSIARRRATGCCASATIRIRARSRSRTRPRGRACRSSFPRRADRPRSAHSATCTPRRSPRCSRSCRSRRSCSRTATGASTTSSSRPTDDVIAVDWQLIDRSVGPRDLAYLVTESVNVPDPAGYEELVRDLPRRSRRARREPRRGVGVRDVPLRRDARLRVPRDRGGRAHHRRPAPHRADARDARPQPRARSRRSTRST